MNKYNIKGQSVDEIIVADYIKINEYGQTELWKNNNIVAVLSKDVSVFKII